MITGGPTIWSIDNYDGEESWLEIGRAPNNEYRHDTQVSANQYHKMACELYNLEGETDKLIQQHDPTMDDNGDTEEWKRIKDQVREVCMKLHVEVEKKQTRQNLNQRRTWNHNSQAHTVKGRTSEEGEQDDHSADDRTLACVTRGMKPRRQKWRMMMKKLMTRMTNLCAV